MTSVRHLCAALVVAVMILSGRAQDDFFSNIYPQEAGMVPACAGQEIDLILLLDSSEKEDVFQAMQKFATDLVQLVNPDNGLVRVGVVAYSSEVNRRIELAEFSRTVDVITAISSLRFQPGRRDTASGLQSMRQLFKESLGDRPGVPNVALLLTTGSSVLRPLEVSKEARKAHDEGIHVFALGVGVDNDRELKDIVSSPTDETLLLAENASSLSQLNDVAFAMMCTRVQSQEVNELRSSNRLDLVFLMHASQETALPQFKTFVKSVIRDADVDGGHVRVGAAVYKRHAEPLFQLNDHRTKASLLGAVDAIPNTLASSSASSAAGLALVDNQMFSADGGDRADVPNVVVVLTDANADVDVPNTVFASHLLQDTGATVFAVGVNLTRGEELEEIASDKSTSFALSSLEELGRVREQIVRHITALEGPKLSGEEGERTPDMSRKLDVVVAFHTGTRLNVKQLNSIVVPFLADLFSASEMDSGQVRVALGFFNKNFKVLGNLLKFKKKADYAAALGKLPKNVRAAKVNGGGALLRIRNKIFTAKTGDRPDAENVVLMVTDENTNVKPKDFAKEAQALRSAGAKIVTVGVGAAVKKEELVEVATPGNGNGNIIMVNDYSDLSNSTVNIRRAVFTSYGAARGPEKKEEVVTPIDRVDDSRQVDIAITFHVQSETNPSELDDSFTPFFQNLFRYADIDGGNVRVAMTNFRKNPTSMFTLNEHATKKAYNKAVEKIDRKIRGKNNDGGDALNDIMQRVFVPTSGDRPEAPNVIIYVTDNEVNLNKANFLKMAEDIKLLGIRIITVGIGAANRKQLQDAASEPASANSFYFATHKDIRSDAAAAAIRNRIYALQDLSAVTEAPRRTPPTTTRAPPPRTPAPTTPAVVPRIDLSRSQKADLVLAIHFNPASSEENFQRLVRWLQGLVRSAAVDSGDVRFGFYIDDQYILFQLDRYDSQLDILEALGTLTKRVARATRFNLNSLLTVVRDRMFVPEMGDRPDVPNGLIIVTDTTSGDDRRTVQQQLARAAQAGIAIYTVGVGLSDKGEMESVASDPRYVYAVSDFAELEGNVHSLRNEIGALSRAGPRPPTGAPPPPPEDECALSRTDLVIVIDSSTSVTAANFVKILDFIKNFLNVTDIDSGNVRVGVVLYSTEVKVQFHLSQYRRKREILQAVGNIRYDFGSTNTAGALKEMREKMFIPVNGDRADVPNVAIVITDGVSNIDAERTVPEAQLAHAEGIHIYSIGIGLTDTRELEGIATPPARLNSFVVNDFDELVFLHNRIFASVCPEDFTMPPTTPKPTTTTTTPTTTTTTRTTTTRTTTTTTTPKPTTTTTRTTTTTTPRPTTTTTPRRRPEFSETGTDLVFMLDGTVNEQVFEWMKNFVRRFAGQLNVDRGEYRVGAMTFATTPQVQFHLNRYNFQDEVIGAVEAFRGARARQVDTARAFEYVRDTMFSSQNGDRPRARNYIVMLTGNERSVNSPRATEAATRLKDLGTDIFTVGINLQNTEEIDAVSSKPLDDYQMLIKSEKEMDEVPGIFLYRMERAPPPVTRTTPTTTTTRRTTTTRPRAPVTPYTGECDSSGDVAFILDSSGSVGEDNFDRVRNFTIQAINDLEIDNGFFRIAVVTFSDSANIEFYLNTHSTKADVIAAVRRIPYVYGYTNTAHALRRTRTEIFDSLTGDRANVPNLIVIVTDGESNINPFETLPEANRIKRGGTSIITVAVGMGSNAELQGLASPPVASNLIFVDDFEALHRLSDQIVAPLCSDSNLCDENPCRNEGICLDGLRSYVCQCQPGFHGDNCEQQCGPKVDVVFILDSSSSIGTETFSHLKTYAEMLVREMNPDSCDVNIGAMKYSSAAMIQFRLGEYDTTEEISRAINNIGYTRGQANMAEALRVLRTEMFNGRNGDRPDARNVAYLLTDGGVEINRDITLSEADLIIDAGVRLIPLAVALRQRSEIELIASAQGMRLLEIESETKLEEMRDQVLEAVFDKSNRCATNPCQNGGKCFSEALGYRCECAEGFTGDQCEKRCSVNADVVFVLDTSRYNSRSDVRNIKKFAREVVKRMLFKGDRFRVGIVDFGSTARTGLTFAEGDNKRTVLSVIGNLRPRSDDPIPANAIQRVDADIVGKLGDREAVPNYVVFLTTAIGGSATVEAINDLKRSGTKIIGVGINLSSSDRRLMESVVSEPVQQMMFHVSDTEDLDSIGQDFTNFVCDERNLCANNPCKNGGVCKNGAKSYVCSCRPGFAGRNCDRACSDRADITFLLDSSGSVGYDNFRRIKEYVYHMVENFNVGPEATQVGVATFSTNAKAQFYLEQYSDKRDLQDAISAISYEYGNTNTAAGLKLVRSGYFNQRRGDRPDVPNYAIVITDGLSNVNAEQTIPEAELAKKQGVHIFAIGVGITDSWELKAIASEPADKNAFLINQFSELWNITEKLIDGTCKDAGICTPNPCRNGGTCLPGVGTYTCQCLTGFVGDNCEQDCQASKDIALVLDSSTSVGPENFGLMLDYVKALVEELSGGGQNHRFSMVTYSTEVNTIFSFNRYDTPQQVLEAIATTRYTPGSTNTAGGLRQARQMFQPGFGSRPTAKDMVILLTDGQSNINFYDTVPAATDLKRDGATVIAIGIGLTNADEINSIASGPRDVFQVATFEALDDIKAEIVQGSCRPVEDVKG